MDDVTIAATFHWLLLAMWHTDRMINIHVSAESKKFVLTEKTQIHFYEWNGHFGLGSDRFEWWVSISKMESRHSCITCRIWWFRLENIATNFYNFILWFQFLAEALKNVLSRGICAVWAMVGRGTGTKQLVLSSLKHLLSYVHYNLLKFQMCQIQNHLSNWQDVRL